MIQLDQVSKHFSNKTVLDSVSYQFPIKKRVALIGANGAGKTTLLNLLCGLDDVDGGQILRQGQVEIGYLPQEPNPDPKATVLLEAQSGNDVLYKLKEAIEASLMQLQTDHRDELVRAHEGLEAEFLRLDGYSLESRATTVLAGLGFSERSLKQSPLELSGGWRMRLELAKIFLNQPNVLILDEPTNHLDLPSLIWVEHYLKNFTGTLIFVSHDRALLNRLANYTILLSNGKLESYPCAFDEALELRSSRLELEEARRENLAKKRQKMEAFVDRFGAKATKARQAQSRVKMIDKLRALESNLNTEVDTPTVKVSLPPPPRCGREVLAIKDLTIGYDSNIPLVKNLSITIERGQKVAVIGANGIGKSTLLKTIVGRIPRLDGQINFGHNVCSAYFSQDHHESLDLDKDCLSNVLAASDKIGEKDARGLLGAFLFSGDDVFKSTAVLSGGEKARVSLAKILVQNANFLLLDEPTNHLDMSSVEALSSAIKDFEGTVLFVSHDRSFIDSICSHVLVVLADGRSMLFEGRLEDYQRMCQQWDFPDVLDPDYLQRYDEKQSQQKVSNPSGKVSLSHQEVKDIKRQRQGFQRKIRELEGIEAQLKARRHEIESKMADLDPRQYEELADLQSKLSQISQEMDDCETTWLETSEALEAIETQLIKYNRA